jgi:hypothetical protein
MSKTLGSEVHPSGELDMLRLSAVLLPVLLIVPPIAHAQPSIHPPQVESIISISAAEL